MVDVSKNTVAVLLVLVIAISGFSVWSLLNHATDTRPAPQTKTVGSNSADLGLTIQTPKEVGYVVLQIGESNG
jgi:hypothetical protein